MLAYGFFQDNPWLDILAKEAIIMAFFMSRRQTTIIPIYIPISVT